MKYTDLIKGEWYYIESTYKWIIKFDYSIDNEYWHTEHVNYETGKYRNSRQYIANPKIIRPATTEELIKFNIIQIESNYEIY